MCGIYGMVALTGALRWPERADQLAAAVRDRGPDAHGRHTSPVALLGVHRLRVVDTTPNADQPFVTDRHVLAINGEVYNSAELYRRYPSFQRTSQSDGESMLPLLADGDPEALSSVAGMFALAHWTEATRTLILARDPAGEKPLFHVAMGNEVWFASSQDALRHHPQLTRALDLDAARDFLSLGVVREPRSLSAGIRMVPAGSAMVFRPHDTLSIHYAASDPVRRPVSATEVGDALDAAIERQLRADVPIGVFLSGGMDSSLVAHTAARHRPGLPAFAVGFPEASYDERPAARRAARHFGLPLTEVLADPTALLRARDVAIGLAEPIADPALLPTILLAERAKQDVTVVLSGEGADELFGGYPTYLGHRLANALPSRLAPFTLRLAPLFGSHRSDRRMPLSWLARRFLESAALPLPERHIAWFSGALPSSVLTSSTNVQRATCNEDPIRWAMDFDRTVYLRERLLVKLDRATMRVGLEARAPFLDPAVVALARAAGPGAHVGFRGKRLLRRVARQRLPSFIVRQTKRGLSVPIGALINGALASETNRLLAPAQLGHLGLVRPGAVAGLLAEHRAGRADHGRALWTLLTFEAWRERHGMDG